MNYAHKPPRRKAVNISLPAMLVDDAKLCGLKISGIAEAALIQALEAAKIDAWAQSNQKGFDALNEMIEGEGLPLESYRKF